MSRLRGRLVLCVLAASLAVSGCSDDPDAATDPAAVGTPDADGILRVRGTDSLQWDPPTLEAPAGEIVFELQCGEQVNHNLVVGDERTLVAECSPGESAQGTLTLEAGEYPFVCTIPGHESSMQGTLTVG